MLLVEYELYLAAARNPALRPLAEVWLDGLRDLLVPQLGAQRAEVASALIDGMILQSLVTGLAPHLARLETALRLLQQGHRLGERRDSNSLGHASCRDRPSVVPSNSEGSVSDPSVSESWRETQNGRE